MKVQFPSLIKSSCFFSLAVTPARTSVHLLRHTLYRNSRYYLTAAIMSFLSFAIVRLLCRYCAPEATLSTGYKYKRLSERERKSAKIARYIFYTVIVASSRAYRTTINAKLFMYDRIATLQFLTENHIEEGRWRQTEDIHKGSIRDETLRLALSTRKYIYVLQTS